MHELIEKYLAFLLGDNPKIDTKRVHTYLTDCMKYFTSRNINVPNEDYTGLEEYLRSLPNGKGSMLSDKSVSDRLRAYKKFYEHMKGEILMLGTSTIETPEKKNGRPIKNTNGEKRTKKFSLYFTPSMYETMNELADAERRSISDIFTELAEDYIMRNEKKLELFRKYIADSQNL